MHVRLVSVTVNPSGTRALSEKRLDVAALTVGRGTDNAIIVPDLTVNLRHCAFRPAADGIHLEASGPAHLRLNGELAPSGILVRTGDVIGVGRHEIRVIVSREDEDLALEVEEVRGISPERELARPVVIGIERGWLSRRRLSGLAAGATVILCLALPLASQRYVRREEDRSTHWSNAARILAAAWSPGPIASAHAHLSDRCGLCHVKPFRAVASADCLACHERTARHVPRPLDLDVHSEARCGICHTEHRAARTLIESSDEPCTACHADLKRRFADTALMNVSDFTADHVQFRPSVVVALGAKDRQRVSIDDMIALRENSSRPREQSGLKFSHSKHLVKRLKSPSGPVELRCDACHVPDATQRLMTSIRFDRYCRECHKLAFDEEHPQREAPHDEPALVSRALSEFYASRALEQEREAESAVVRGRPGRKSGLEERRAKMMAWASSKARSAEERLLGENGPCALCHYLERAQAEMRVVRVFLVPLVDAREKSQGRAQGGPFESVGAVGVSDGVAGWMPLARFNHRPHAVVECVECHAVRDAKTSEEIDLPGIATCRGCHGSAKATHRAEASCILCHDFHLDRYGPMLARPGTDEAS